jgi:hypothetical protein
MSIPTVWNKNPVFGNNNSLTKYSFTFETQKPITETLPSWFSQTYEKG